MFAGQFTNAKTEVSLNRFNSILPQKFTQRASSKFPPVIHKQQCVLILVLPIRWLCSFLKEHGLSFDNQTIYMTFADGGIQRHQIFPIIASKERSFQQKR
ncbi:hypothetical protein CEXT_509421 [Caerostris extrusa]|uniref:LAGLIDADG homing endonuclease n=1 Tax=Caerostris extrusa TaxID=172846 RepID=A0AAV4NAM0_CAEEX|nr:hypothetical protein CEXT_509421 [Caerostris extrusa]